MNIKNNDGYAKSKEVSQAFLWSLTTLLVRGHPTPFILTLVEAFYIHLLRGASCWQKRKASKIWGMKRYWSLLITLIFEWNSLGGAIFFKVLDTFRNEYSIIASKLRFPFGEKKSFLLISHSPTQSLPCLKSEMPLCVRAHVHLISNWNSILHARLHRVAQFCKVRWFWAWKAP